MSGSIDIDQNAVGSAVNSGIQIGERTLQGVQAQGSNIGTALGVVISVGLYFVLLFGIILAVKKLIEYLKGYQNVGKM